MGGYKVLLVEDAHLLSDAAANALLKTLEEPRGKACIILTARHERLLLPTLRSRSHIIPFQLVSSEELASALKERSAPDPEALARQALGAPGLALAALEHPEVAEQLQERTQKAQDCLHGSLHERILAARNLIPTYQEDHVVTRTELLDRLVTFEVLARDQLLQAVGCQELASGSSEKRFTADQSVRALKQVERTRAALHQHLNPKVSLINLMLTIA